MIPYKERCCFYKLIPKLQPGDKNEVVSIIEGAAANIRRWHDDNSLTQQWLIVPVDQQRCRIQTRSVASSEEYMAVGSNGNILRWNEGGETLFDFRKSDDEEWFYIKEPTKGECVSTGSDGNLLRWACGNGDGFKFKLVPIAPKTPPVPRKSTYTPYAGGVGAIPGPPKIASWSHLPPERSPMYFIGEVVLPASVVDDPNQRSRLDQVEISPYYTLMREQYWDRGNKRGAYERWNKADAETRTREVTVGFTQTQSESMEKTLRILVTASSQFNFEHGSASFSTEIETALKTTSTTSTTRMKQEKEKVELRKPQGSRAVKTNWSLVDCYTLKDYQNHVVSKWEIVNLNTRAEESFVPPPDKISLYPHNNFEGVGLNLDQDKRQLPPKYDNQVSSIRVHSGEWEVFSDPSFQKLQAKLTPHGGPNGDGRYPDPSTWGGAQDTISSVRIAVA